MEATVYRGSRAAACRCRCFAVGREGINASLFRRWRSTLKDSGEVQPVVARSVPAPEVAVPFIDLGDLRSGGSRVEVRLDLGAGIVLSVERR